LDFRQVGKLHWHWLSINQWSTTRKTNVRWSGNCDHPIVCAIILHMCISRRCTSGARGIPTLRDCVSEIALRSVKGNREMSFNGMRLSWVTSCSTMNRCIFVTPPRPSIVFWLIDQLFVYDFSRWTILRILYWG
jgi:hypothetical protein